MSERTISALVAVDEGIDADEVRAILATVEDVDVSLVVEGLRTAWDSLAGSPSDAVLLACSPDSDTALWFIRETVARYPERPVVVVSAPSANGFVGHAFEAGADDLVMPTPGVSHDTAVIGGQIRFALEKALARRTGTAVSPTSALARMICVLGPKGGIGKTLTTANLAVALADAGQRVAVVDLDLQFGDVGLALGLTPARTIYDLVKSGGSMDTEKLDGYLTAHDSGVRVLMAPVRPDQASAVTVDFLREIYPLLRAMHDFVLVDTPPGFTPEVIASIDGSTDVCMVGTLDTLSLKNTKLGLETLELMGYSRDRIRLVLNRADSRVGVSQDDVAAVIGRQPDVLVPSHRDIARATNNGVSIVTADPRSEATRAFTSLASAYLGASARSGRRPLFRRKG
ncbi:MAG: pilus assembly protein CpaE [Solirubrobacteraceae bacterium]|jgi:pilus assembly protein CpaE|nr:pilus assembly protein CpaE [Solirubrobacteraceae bacterium]